MQKEQKINPSLHRIKKPSRCYEVSHLEEESSAPDTLRSADKTTSRSSRRVARQPHRRPIQSHRLAWSVLARHGHCRSSRCALHYRCSPRAKDAILPVSLAIALDHSTRRTSREECVLVWWAARCSCCRATPAMSLAHWNRALVCGRASFHG